VQLNDQTRLSVFALAAALLVGGFLRFFQLGRADLTPDEAYSWAAAAAPSAAEVVRLQAKLNPGKLAVHDLALHAWIGAFGAGVTAMRALSAVLGTIQIALVFWVAREIFLLARPGEQPGGGGDSAVSPDFTAALSAFIFAVNLLAVKYAREARMYSVLMAMVLAQAGLLLRSRRKDTLANYAALAIFTALAVATNFTAVFVIVSEALWLLFFAGARRSLTTWKTLGGMGAGILAFIAMTAGAVHTSVETLNNGVLNFIPYPTLWNVISFFDYATLSYALVLVLALWGVVAGWSGVRASIIFALFWMWGPVILLYIISLTVAPLLVTRYALSSFVPFMVLAALGVSYCGSIRAQSAALALVIILSLVQFVSYVHRSPTMEWQHGVEQIRAYRPSAVIAVAPARGANLIRYYLTGKNRYRVVGLTDNASCTQSEILVVWNGGMIGSLRKQAQDCSADFTHLLYQHQDFSVLGR
jgi:Dolichyl-phosphate-mannose-protein mannosyltransferase